VPVRNSLTSREEDEPPVTRWNPIASRSPARMLDVTVTRDDRQAPMVHNRRRRAMLHRLLRCQPTGAGGRAIEVCILIRFRLAAASAARCSRSCSCGTGHTDTTVDFAYPFVANVTVSED
jgi:hypothetical protein